MANVLEKHANDCGTEGKKIGDIADDAESNSATCSLSLIERLNAELGAIREDNPFYWYFRLKSLGKLAQTEEMVNEAVDSFIVSNDIYTILRFVAKKYLTYDVCIKAVSKNGMNLEYVPMRYRDADMCLRAVRSNGRALRDVPEQILLGKKGYDLCLIAVGNDFYGIALSFVPDRYFKGDKGKVLCETAVRSNGYSFEHVPAHLRTKALARLAVNASFPIRDITWPDGSHATRNAYSAHRPILSIIPNELVSKELAIEAIRLHPENMKYVPIDYLSRELCLEAIEQDVANLRYMPSVDKTLINYAVNMDPQAVRYVPKSYLTLKLCRDALRKDPSISIEGFPEAIRKKLEKEFPVAGVVPYKPIALKMPMVSSVNEVGQIAPITDKALAYDLATAEGPITKFYYITDIHLEHQLVEDPDEITKLSLSEIKHRMNLKIAEIIATVPDTNSVLLVGGDVADCAELESLFYEQLTAFDGWRGKVIATLGNHELWDGDPMGIKPARSLDEIIATYRQLLPSRITLLENELFIMYKGLRGVVLDEQTILNASIEEVTKVCADSTFIVLGGIGFSGLNPVYNANYGLYRAAVSMEEDTIRSQRFRAVYEKVLSCAAKLRVIVLTHTQMNDWSDARYNRNWIYISGHTHRNKLLLQEDGTAVFYDNQVGYQPKPWHLNSFTLNVHRYDPLKNLSNGIHRITRDQYIEFNRCQGIRMEDMRHPGSLYALKYDGVYMFVLKTDSSLCLLEGGSRHRLDYDIDYYFDNLPIYLQKVHSAFAPYQKALSIISDEVKAIGGTGLIHGCIVDVDWFNHVYLNPFDGKVTPYFALDMTAKMFFENMQLLLETSPIPPQLADGSSMLARYSALVKEDKLPILSQGPSKKWGLAGVPQIVLDKAMYEPSRIMRSIQYVFDQNVLRVWNDSILDIEDGNERNALIDTERMIDSK